MRKFTTEEDNFLRRNYKNIPAKRMAKMLGRTEGTARQRMKLLGIVVPPEIIEQFKRDSYIKKGSVPMNKGKRLAEYCSRESIERMKATQFSKGHTPLNHKPVGSTRLSKDGYLEIKVQEPNVWQAYHRLMWEETFGPIPEKMNVQFVTRDKMNVSPWNLELVSKAGNMKRNSYHNYGPEIAKLVQLSGVLKRQINKQKRNINEYQQSA